MKTKTQAVEAFLAGEMVFIGEYRMSKAEMLKWRDKVTGAARQGPILRHTVEVGASSIAVAERVPDGTALESLNEHPFPKGSPVLVSFTEVRRDKGSVSVRGALEALYLGPESNGPAARSGSSVGRGQVPVIQA